MKKILTFALIVVMGITLVFAVENRVARYVLPPAAIAKVVKPIPARESVPATPRKKQSTFPARERVQPAQKKPATSQDGKLPVSCATVRWYAAHMPQSVLDALEKKYKPTAAQKKAAQACLNGAA